MKTLSTELRKKKRRLSALRILGAAIDDKVEKAWNRYNDLKDKASDIHWDIQELEDEIEHP
jgi:predicted nucleotidyltransferase component of viral defense system